MSAICQSHYPERLRTARALPGIAPLSAGDWLEVDDAFAAQMTRREALLKDQKDKVLAHVEDSRPAREEALAEALKLLAHDARYELSTSHVRRPDGQTVDLQGEPLEVLGRLVQEDICLMQKPEGAAEHVLSAACLCFPASWTLAEKIGKPLLAIHDPVAEYDDTLARRVQRLFDGVQVGRPLWRFNQLWYADAELHQPRSVYAPREEVSPIQGDFLRMEKQSIVRLPQTRAVVFSIHTYVLNRADVPEDIARSTRSN
ncbi:DUF3445 domain-containing protein [Planktotalea sp.]|uniref:heme-dependent oxidative N-demethylase family protein n=1 Tax=Planktotalea sp. TaxID=2029877 RepID=UPI003298F681